MFSEVRKVLFSGMGWYDYDISNTYFSIIYNLYNHYFKENSELLMEDFFTTHFRFLTDMNLIAVKMYLDNKKQYRDALAKELGISKVTAKEILLALIFRAKIVPVYGTTIFKLLNRNKNIFKKMTNKAFTMVLHDELILASDIILKCSQRINRKNKKYIKNLLGKFLEVNKKVKIVSMLSHILQGVEAEIIDIACKRIGNEIRILIYDGFISSINYDEKKLSNEIRREFYKRHKISMPITIKKEELIFDLTSLEI
jgi:hypothetical protein